MAITNFSGPVQSDNGFLVGAGKSLTKLLSNSAALNFPSISANAYADLTITVTGAAVNDAVIMGLPAAPAAGLVFNAFVSATDTVTVRASNTSASPVDAASATYNVVVLAATTA